MNWRALAAVVGLVALCLVCLAALENIGRSLRERNPPPLPRIDYVLDEVELLRHRPGGTRALQITASRIVHHRETQLLEVQQPELRRLGDPSEQLVATAARATVHKGHDQIDLHGGVQLERRGPDQAMRLTTEHMVIQVEAQLALTDAPVEIRQGASILRGRGLHADLRAAHYKILADVEARYVPVPRRSAARAAPAPPAPAAAAGSEPAAVAVIGAGAED